MSEDTPQPRPRGSARAIHYCVQCGRQSDDWMVEAGIVKPAYSWCGECKRVFAEKIQERLLEELCRGLTKKN